MSLTHLHTCFLWADSLNCLANTDSWGTLKTRLIPGHWQTGLKGTFAEKIRLSKFLWSQASQGEGWLFIWCYIATHEFLWEDHGRGPSSCEHLWPSKVMSWEKAQQTVLWNSHWRHFEEFVHILISHLCLGLFFLVALSHKVPPELWRFDWTRITTSQAQWGLNVEGPGGCIPPTYPVF